MFRVLDAVAVYGLGHAALIGIGAIHLTLIGHPDAATTAGITTAVVMVVAALSPHEAWREPILRMVDTIVGAIVGLGAAWGERQLCRCLNGNPVCGVAVEKTGQTVAGGQAS